MRTDKFVGWISDSVIHQKTSAAKEVNYAIANPPYTKTIPPTQAGFTLIEMVVFLVVIAIALGALLAVYNQSVVNSVDPIVRVKMLEIAQSQLDEVAARKYDESTPTGGIPACGSAESGAQPCSFGLDAGEILTNPATLDDVDDFDNYTNDIDGYIANVAVILAGSEIGITGNQAKRITVTVISPGGEALTLSSYRTNF